jgi:hypothetical protein
MIVLASKASGCVFSKIKLKIVKHVSWRALIGLENKAWLEFMKLCAKERKIIYGIVYRKIKKITQ